VGKTESVSYPPLGHQNLAEVEEKSFWFDHRVTVLRAILGKYPPGGPIFDVGGGSGFTVRDLRRAGYDAILIEPGEHACRVAVSRGLAPILWGTTNSLGAADGSLSAIGVFDVVEHIADDQDFLAHLHHLLQPSGRLYVTVPSYRFLWSGSDLQAGHFRRYTLRHITRAVTEARFRVLYASYMFQVLVLPIALFRALPHRLGVRRGDEAPPDAHLVGSGPLGMLVRSSLKRELSRIKRGQRVRYGSSIVVAAEKLG
jgi:SAM-dependent methyltransferase